MVLLGLIDRQNMIMLKLIVLLKKDRIVLSFRYIFVVILEHFQDELTE